VDGTLIQIVDGVKTTAPADHLGTPPADQAYDTLDFVARCAPSALHRTWRRTPPSAVA
jgi:hypothetical protein